MCILDLLENWRRLTCYQRAHKGRDALGRPIPRDYAVPTTNNATEHSTRASQRSGFAASQSSIGRAIKVRSKLTRGFKSVSGALSTMMLVACVGGVLAGVSFEQLTQ